MASTTLITFLLRLPRSVRTVDLLGSWDNFQQTYPLQKDRQAGPGHWRGCHRFKNITCDGQNLDPSMSRDGALKMGGTYWYYYKLDGELEQHDPVEPSTTTCPLLLGQQVNILEVPTLGQHETEPDEWSRRLLESTVFTLDPKAKYSSPGPSLHQLPNAQAQGPPTEFQYTYGQSTASTKTLQLLERDLLRPSQRSCAASSKVSLLMAIFQKLRGTRSAPSTSKEHADRGEKSSGSSKRKLSEMEHLKASGHYEPFTNLMSSRLRAPVNTPDWPSVIAHTAPIAPWTADSSINSRESSAKVMHPAMPGIDFKGPTASVISDDQQLARGSGSPSSAHSNVLNQSWYLPDLVATGPHNSTADLVKVSLESTTKVEQKCLKAVQHAASPLVLPIQSNVVAQNSSADVNMQATNRNGLQRSVRPPSLLFDTRENLSNYYATSLSLGGQLSPHYLSQPESPSVRDFEEAWESGYADPPSYLGSNRGNSPLADLLPNSSPFELLEISHSPNNGGGRFKGYSLPEPEHASDLTLRKPASVMFSPKQELSSNDHLVQSWNDGMTHGPITALDELVDELGYLGKMIV